MRSVPARGLGGQCHCFAHDGTLPLGTLFVNVSGCLLVGGFTALLDPAGRWLAPLEVPSCADARDNNA
ncbi:MAG: hypothetical protein ACR2ID_04810 [Chthoniobacterales bacterium]